MTTQFCLVNPVLLLFRLHQLAASLMVMDLLIDPVHAAHYWPSAMPFRVNDGESLNQAGVGPQLARWWS